MKKYYKVVRKTQNGLYRSALIVKPFALTYRIWEKIGRPEKNSLGIFVFATKTDAKDWASDWNLGGHGGGDPLEHDEERKLVILSGIGERTTKKPKIVVHGIFKASNIREYYQKMPLAEIYKSTAYSYDLADKFDIDPDNLQSLPDGAVTLEWFEPQQEEL